MVLEPVTILSGMTPTHAASDLRRSFILSLSKLAPLLSWCQGSHSEEFEECATIAPYRSMAVCTCIGAYPRALLLPRMVFIEHLSLLECKHHKKMSISVLPWLLTQYDAFRMRRGKDDLPIQVLDRLNIYRNQNLSKHV
jgi:hypothetical protein